MRKLRRISILTLAVLLLPAAACAPKVQQPELWLTGVRLVSLGLRGGVIDVELGVYNPNGFSIRAGGLTYDLDFEDPGGEGWLDFSEGRVNERLTVGAGDTASVVIPVEFSYRGLSGAVRGLLDRGSFEYRVDGEVAVEAPVVRDIPYRHRGTVTPDGIQ